MLKCESRLSAFIGLFYRATSPAQSITLRQKIICSKQSFCISPFRDSELHSIRTLSVAPKRPKWTICRTKKEEAFQLPLVVPPGNIIKRVTYCVLALLMFSLIRCSRIAHGHNSPFFTTLYRLFSTATKVVNFLDFRVRKREYNFVATKPKYPTLCRASCQAVQQTTQVHHHDIAAMCV